MSKYFETSRSSKDQLESSTVMWKDRIVHTPVLISLRIRVTRSLFGKANIVKEGPCMRGCSGATEELSWVWSTLGGEKWQASPISQQYFKCSSRAWAGQTAQKKNNTGRIQTGSLKIHVTAAIAQVYPIPHPLHDQTHHHHNIHHCQNSHCWWGLLWMA